MDTYSTQRIVGSPRETWDGSLFGYSGGARYDSFLVPLFKLNRYWIAFINSLNALGWDRETIRLAVVVEQAPTGFGYLFREYASSHEGWSEWWILSTLSFQYDHKRVERRFTGRTVRAGQSLVIPVIQHMPRSPVGGWGTLRLASGSYP